MPNMTQPITINDLSMTTIVNGVVISSNNIPPALQQIVNWVLMAITQQVKGTCNQCIEQPGESSASSNTTSGSVNNATSSTGNATTVGNATTTTGTSTGTGTGTL